jgi:hypothetical protein
MELCRSGRASGTHSVSMLRSKCIAPCTGATLPASMIAVCMYCRACCLCLPAGCAEAAVSFLIVLLPCPATAMTSLVPLSLERCCTEHTVNICNCTEFTAEWTTRRNLPRCRCWSTHGPADPSMSVEITQDAGQPVLYPLKAPDLCSTQRVHVTQHGSTSGRLHTAPVTSSKSGPLNASCPFCNQHSQHSEQLQLLLHIRPLPCAPHSA